MDSFVRLLVRFILVPLGYLAAVIAGGCVILFGSWKFGTALTSGNSDAFSYGLFGMVIAGPILFGTLLVTMWLPAAVGVLISEAFAIRSWIFHALNGAASAWLGWQMFGAFDKSDAAAERAAIRDRGRARGRLCLLGGRGTQRRLLEADLSAARAQCRCRRSDPFNPPAQTKA